MCTYIYIVYVCELCIYIRHVGVLSIHVYMYTYTYVCVQQSPLLIQILQIRDLQCGARMGQILAPTSRNTRTLIMGPRPQERRRMSDRRWGLAAVMMQTALLGRSRGVFLNSGFLCRSTTFDQCIRGITKGYISHPWLRWIDVTWYHMWHALLNKAGIYVGVIMLDPFNDTLMAMVFGKALTSMCESWFNQLVISVLHGSCHSGLVWLA